MSSTVKAYAKINLFLDITGRLPNGYHTLNTVMQQIDLYDILRISRTDGGINVTCGNPNVPCNEKNIAYRAAAEFFAETGIHGGAEIDIEKNIPLEAGLGGSSTDGAAVLAALNSIFGEPLDHEQLCGLGASLGADVPFCLTGGTAVCGGIGERIRPIPCKKDYFIVIAKPDFSCNTAQAYRKFDISPIPQRDGFSRFAALLGNGCEAWSGAVYNVFEQLYRDERIEAVTNELKEKGALCAALSGSGSAVFGIFSDENKAKKAAEIINLPFCRVINPV